MSYLQVLGCDSTLSLQGEERAHRQSTFSAPQHGDPAGGSGPLSDPPAPWSPTLQRFSPLQLLPPLGPPSPVSLLYSQQKAEEEDRGRPPRRRTLGPPGYLHGAGGRLASVLGL